MVLVLVCGNAYAGTIRSVEVSKKKMARVNLALGQSTVLRFDKKPKKAVLGNKNYFNLEFIDNDVTLQPLGEAVTNLFIYDKDSNVYGFTLYAANEGRHDDLLVVSRERKSHKVVKKKKTPKFRISKIDLALNISKVIELRFHSVKHDPKRGYYLVDGIATNHSGKKIETSELKLDLTRSSKSLKQQEFAFTKSSLTPGQACRVRVFVKVKEKRGFTINLKYDKNSTKQILSRRFL